MSITITLIIQGFALFLVAWLVMKLGWPSIIGAIEARQKKIADGLAAADRGQKDLDEAKAQALDIVRDARTKAAQIVEQANRRGGELVEEARGTAVAEGERLIAVARNEIATESARARGDLRNEVAHLALVGASQVLKREIDPKAHAQLLDELAQRIAAAR
ncbi:MAG TPA: F0F1 ATP synthase subunit B [Steroidobacteraceae bacterium]|nr:F0F1 ATP synthase subunit B [Steroidobacteraceae bacterium]